MKTTIQEPWALGVDPGYGHTGAVLRRADYPSPVSWACWENHHTNDWCIMRSMSIVVPMMEATLGWVVEHEINDLEVCIEYPIYNGNARVLMVQMLSISSSACSIQSSCSVRRNIASSDNVLVSRR